MQATGAQVINGNSQLQLSSALTLMITVPFGAVEFQDYRQLSAIEGYHQEVIWPAVTFCGAYATLGVAGN